MTQYRQSKRVVAREVRGERLLVPLASTAEELDAIYVLNESAALVWDALAAGATAQDVSAALVAAYEVSEDDAEKDARRLIADLVGTGAVEPVDD